MVEQVLASHPQIHGLGELQDVHNIFQTLPEVVGQSAENAFDALDALSPDSARRAARRYLERLDALAPSTAVRVVDKMPDNIRLLGLIAVLWPTPGHRLAEIFAILRCHAGKRTSCRSGGPMIGNRSRGDSPIIDASSRHWRQTKPVPWLDVRYEDMVGDLEGHARRLIDFLGLDWDPACLEFYSTGARYGRPASYRSASPFIPIGRTMEEL